MSRVIPMEITMRMRKKGAGFAYFTACRLMREAFDDIASKAGCMRYADIAELLDRNPSRAIVLKNQRLNAIETALTEGVRLGTWRQSTLDRFRILGKERAA